MATIIKVRFRFGGTGTMLKKRSLEKGGLVQQTIDKAAIDWCQQYTPWETGTLSKSAYSATTIGEGRIVYPGPYARYQYYGEVYGPNLPKEVDEAGNVIQWASPPKKYPTGRQLQYSTDVNPLAGAFWFERMKADHSKDILMEAKKVAGIK